MPNLKKICLSLAIVAAAALSPVTSFAQSDEIAIYKSTSSEKCVEYFQGGEYEYYDMELDEIVTESYEGGSSKYSYKTTSYIVFAKFLGLYREVNYYSYSYRNEEGKKVKVKEYFASTGFIDDYDGYTPASLFETDPTSKRNYLVASLNGTGMDFNHFADMDFPDPGDTSYGVNGETITGQIKTQKIKHATGTVECEVPSKLSGKLFSETENYSDAQDQISRYYCDGKITLKLDKARTREYIDAGGLSLADGVDAVIEYLESKGYVDGSLVTGE